jgi:hypothetical protein
MTYALNGWPARFYMKKTIVRLPGLFEKLPEKELSPNRQQDIFGKDRRASCKGMTKKCDRGVERYGK